MSCLLPERPAHENTHPLAGQVRRLHTTFENLHGQRFLVVDWYSRVQEVPGTTLEALRQDFTSRCAKKCEHPVIEKMSWFFEQRVIVGYLGGSTSGTPMLIDTDELPDLKLLMADAHDNSLAIVRRSSEALLEGLAHLTKYARLSATSRSKADSMTATVNEIIGLLKGDDVLFTEAGITNLERTLTLAAGLHDSMNALYDDLEAAAAARQIRYHANNGWMRHCEYYDRVGGRDAYVHEHDEEDNGSALEKVATLRHSTQLNYSPIPGTSLYLRDALRFSRHARARFDWLTAWESGQI